MGRSNLGSESQNSPRNVGIVDMFFLIGQSPVGMVKEVQNSELPLSNGSAEHLFNRTALFPRSSGNPDHV